jgi:hypothetical protein
MMPSFMIMAPLQTPTMGGIVLQMDWYMVSTDRCSVQPCRTPAFGALL